MAGASGRTPAPGAAAGCSSEQLPALRASPPIAVTALEPRSPVRAARRARCGSRSASAAASIWRRRPRPTPMSASSACEPFVNGVAALLAPGGGAGLANVRILNDDARLLLAALPEASIDRAFMLFPDPWPKARHHKRRLIVHRGPATSWPGSWRPAPSCGWRPTIADYAALDAGAAVGRARLCLAGRAGRRLAQPARPTGRRPATRRRRWRRGGGRVFLRFCADRGSGGCRGPCDRRPAPSIERLALDVRDAYWPITIPCRPTGSGLDGPLRFCGQRTSERDIRARSSEQSLSADRADPRATWASSSCACASSGGTRRTLQVMAEPQRPARR